jgi:hypothetical protein
MTRIIETTDGDGNVVSRVTERKVRRWPIVLFWLLLAGLAASIWPPLAWVVLVLGVFSVIWQQYQASSRRKVTPKDQ